MAENVGNVAAPQVIYETTEMTPEQVAETNAAYRAMGVGLLVVSISRFCGKLERQSDGSYRRVVMRRRRGSSDTNEAGTDTG